MKAHPLALSYSTISPVLPAVMFLGLVLLSNAFFQISVSVDEPEGYEITNDSINGDQTCIHPGSSESYKLKLKATSLGKINITVRAETAQSTDACGDSEVSSAFARDAITQSLVVEVRRVTLTLTS